MARILFNAKTWLTGIEILLSFSILTTDEAVVPPPWANPKLNPCATQPGGWQLLFWPPDGKCYKIFQIGYPCPQDMELSPAPVRSRVGSISQDEFSAECRCPPRTAQSARDGRCYQLYSLGPCEKGFYFAPDKHYNANNKSKRLWGICVQTQQCPNPGDLYWPQDGKCYQRHTRGPCPKGQLLTISSDKLTVCRCQKDPDLGEYYYRDGQCYQHFTKGPCRERGHLFLPDRTCGCYNFLPHYHQETGQCFEIGTLGPCKPGEQYHFDSYTGRATCQCKKSYVRHLHSGICYRPFTQGPCEMGHILINTTTCIPQPCQRGELYFPSESRCYRIGTRGPCRKGRLVTFDFNTRPSVEGISYNGLCECQKHLQGTSNCKENDSNGEIECKRGNGMIKYGNTCFKLYTKGPCPKGAWLVPVRTRKHHSWSDSDRSEVINGDFVENNGAGSGEISDNDDNNSNDSTEINNTKLSEDSVEGSEVIDNKDSDIITDDIYETKQAICECMPGYMRTLRMLNDGKNITDCMSPTVILADYLNNNYSFVTRNEQ